MKKIGRRRFMKATLLGAAVLALPACATQTGSTSMYGLIGKMKAISGQRDALASILLEGVSQMRGCLSWTDQSFIDTHRPLCA